MKNKFVMAVVLAGGLMAANVTVAADFQEQMNACLEKHANTHDKASVLLECDAQNGKLANCKVVENSAAGKGFDKAAMCIADSMPMAGKTGTIRVPFRFSGEG
jgi:hypothetical protein